MEAYKGFNPDMTCREFQYKEGETYTEDKAELCNCGFHACEDPVDCFNYYDPAESVFHEVELGEVSSERESDTKVVAKKITIGEKVDIASMVKASIDFRFSKTTEEKGGHATGDSGAASATGNSGAASATGYRGAASATGYRGAASATGNRGAASATGNSGAASATGYSGAASATGDSGAASATGDRGAASATGDRGAASATGNSGAASATGYRGAASATGYRGAASATGYRGAASATGKAGIALAAGVECKAMGALGCWIVLTERVWDNVEGYYRIKEVRALEVDGVNIKPEVWYMLKDGKVIEV